MPLPDSDDFDTVADTAADSTTGKSIIIAYRAMRMLLGTLIPFSSIASINSLASQYNNKLPAAVGDLLKDIVLHEPSIPLAVILECWSKTVQYIGTNVGIDGIYIEIRAMRVAF